MKASPRLTSILRKSAGFSNSARSASGAATLRAVPFNRGAPWHCSRWWCVKKNPFDAAHADFGEMVQHAAVAEVDQERRIAVAKDIDIAGVSPDEEVGQSLGVDLAEACARRVWDRSSRLVQVEEQGDEREQAKRWMSRGKPRSGSCRTDPGLKRIFLRA